MGGSAAPGPGRIGQRLRLSHVHERSYQQLRERWQRRLDRGEEVYCWSCQLKGIATPVDPQRWHLRDDRRTPECAACHEQAAGS